MWVVAKAEYMRTWAVREEKEENERSASRLLYLTALGYFWATQPHRLSLILRTPQSGCQLRRSRQKDANWEPNQIQWPQWP